jgi:hypothetical protein
LFTLLDGFPLHLISIDRETSDPTLEILSESYYGFEEAPTLKRRSVDVFMNKFEIQRLANGF